MSSINRYSIDIKRIGGIRRYLEEQIIHQRIQPINILNLLLLLLLLLLYLLLLGLLLLDRGSSALDIIYEMTGIGSTRLTWMMCL